MHISRNENLLPDGAYHLLPECQLLNFNSFYIFLKGFSLLVGYTWDKMSKNPRRYLNNKDLTDPRSCGWEKAAAP